MAVVKRRTTRKPARAQTLEEKAREEIFWTVATILLIAATVIFVPILFAPFK